MGDTWPFRPPDYTTWQAVYDEIYFFTHDKSLSATMAAIGSAESSLDLTVVNDTPATGDYSVGVFQINYYDGLWSSRVQQFGTPQYLATNGIGPQARAALALVNDSNGLNNWTTYTSGAYKQYLHGFTPTIGPVPSSSGSGFWLPPPAKLGRDDYSPTIRITGNVLGDTARRAHGYGNVLTAALRKAR